VIASNRGDFAGAVELANKALSLVPANDIDRQAGARMTLGASYIFQGLYDKAEPLLREAYGACIKLGATSSAATSLVYLGMVAMHQDKPHEAERMIKKGLSASELNTNHGVTALIYLHFIYWEWNRLPEAAAELEKAMTLARFIGYRRHGLLAYRAHIRMCQGDIEGAAQDLAEADGLLAAGKPSGANLRRLLRLITWS